MLVFILLTLVVVLAAAYVAAGVYFAEAFTRVHRRRVEGTPEDLGLRYDEIQFNASDGMALRGWYLAAPNARATVVVLHDLNGTRADASQGLLYLQRDYLRRGFNVLAFDLRGRGESGGVRNHMGSAERRDVAAAVRYARSRALGLPVVLHGFGLGASLAIVTAAEGVRVDAIVADSPFATARGYLRERWHMLPDSVFALACRLSRRIYKAHTDVLSPLAAMPALGETPVLFIHGEADRHVPVTDSINLAAASLNERDVLLRIPGAGHCAAYLFAPEAYMRRCLTFIELALPARHAPAVAV